MKGYRVERFRGMSICTYIYICIYGYVVLMFSVWGSGFQIECYVVRSVQPCIIMEGLCSDLRFRGWGLGFRPQDLRLLVHERSGLT